MVLNVVVRMPIMPERLFCSLGRIERTSTRLGEVSGRLGSAARGAAETRTGVSFAPDFGPWYTRRILPVAGSMAALQLKIRALLSREAEGPALRSPATPRSPHEGQYRVRGRAGANSDRTSRTF
jgi:hypothetical protein